MDAAFCVPLTAGAAEDACPKAGIAAAVANVAAKRRARHCPLTRSSRSRFAVGAAIRIHSNVARHVELYADNQGTVNVGELY